MIDTVMALWNREYTGKEVKLFSVLLVLCISISLLLVVESGPVGAPGSDDTYGLKNGLNTAEHATGTHTNGGPLNSGALTPTLVPQPYVTVPAGLLTPAPSTLGVNPNPSTPTLPSPGVGSLPTVTATASAVPTVTATASAVPTGTPAVTPTPAPTPPPTATPTPTPTSTPPPTPMPTPAVTPTPTAMGGMTATPVATQTPAAVTPAPTGNASASTTPTPATAPSASAASTPGTTATGRDILLAGMAASLITPLMDNTMAAGISVVTLIAMLCQLALCLAKRRRAGHHQDGSFSVRSGRADGRR